MKIMTKAGEGGFTIIELLITIAISAAIVVVMVANLYPQKSKKTLDSTARHISAVLHEAQSLSMSQSKGTGWGVRFDNTTTSTASYSLVQDSTSSGIIIDTYYRLPPSIYFSATSVPVGTKVDVLFSPISGAANATATVTVYSGANAASPISIQILKTGSVQ